MPTLRILQSGLQENIICYILDDMGTYHKRVKTSSSRFKFNFFKQSCDFYTPNQTKKSCFLRPHFPHRT